MHLITQPQNTWRRTNKNEMHNHLEKGVVSRTREERELRTLSI